MRVERIGMFQGRGYRRGVGDQFDFGIRRGLEQVGQVAAGAFERARRRSMDQ